MKNVNKWWYFNPLFVLYTDDPFYISMLKDPNQKKGFFGYRIHDDDFNPFDPDRRQMDRRETYETESRMVNHRSSIRLRQQFSENETFEDFLYPLKDEPEKLPIALITFVLSVFVATDFSLRHGFYGLYQGKKIPAITQWSLNTFRVSPISDTETITGFRFIDDEYGATQYCCGLGVSFADIRSLKNDPERMVAWFNVLNQHFSTDQNHYLELVDFTRVPSVSTDKNYLCGLTAGDQGVTASKTSYFHELSESQKHVYTMLARVLDRVCVPENTDLPVPHKNLLERRFDEQEITAKLIRFIVSECKGFLT